MLEYQQAGRVRRDFAIIGPNSLDTGVVSHFHDAPDTDREKSCVPNAVSGSPETDGTT
ncbi:hypothetical protein QZH46_01315 [Pseudomonas corrugata]